MINMLVETEDLSDGANDVVSIRLRGLPADFGNGPVRHLVHYAFGEPLNGLFLFRSERPELGAPARDFTRSQTFELFLELDDGRRHFASLQARHHALHFLMNDRLGVFGR